MYTAIMTASEIAAFVRDFVELEVARMCETKIEFTNGSYLATLTPKTTSFAEQLDASFQEGMLFFWGWNKKFAKPTGNTASGDSQHTDAVRENLCPECGEKASSNCKCPRTDSTCKNGHKWHTCTIHHVIVKGHSDHSTSTFTCTCGMEAKR